MAPGPRRDRRKWSFHGTSAATGSAPPAPGGARAGVPSGQRNHPKLFFTRNPSRKDRIGSTMEAGAQSNVSSSAEDVFRQTMALAVLRQIRQALATLNPRELRDMADRPLRVGLIAPSADALGRMETYFAPHHFSPARRAQAAQSLIP